MMPAMAMAEMVGRSCVARGACDSGDMEIKGR